MIDGDTLVLLVNSALTFGKVATVEPVTIDRYGRTVAEIFVQVVHVNREMVRNEDAWVYRKYATDETLFTLENKALAQKLGL